MIRFALTASQREVYRRYAGLALPRHTSFPIAPVWSDQFGPGDFRAALARSATSGRDGSLYVHVPFCAKLCYYCACTKEIVPDARRKCHDPAEDFLTALPCEVRQLAASIGPMQFRQVHFGGGTPTFLTAGQLERLVRILRDHFAIDPAAEFAVELDPRVTSRAQLSALAGLGVTRASLGVQDFDLRVQRAVNRVQSFESVERLVGWCRELGISWVNFDLIFGLPFQTPESMGRTLDLVLSLRPSRVAYYRLAVIPELFRVQKSFCEADLPCGEGSLELNLLGINRFLDAGYEFIGLDHFAVPEEPLAKSARDGTLRRNFQGMTTGKPLDVIGLGPSAISQTDDAFAQNVKESGAWGEALGRDLATVRGKDLSPDDRLRREVLQRLYGSGRVDRAEIESQFGIRFGDYFADELRRLDELVADGLVEIDEARVSLTPVLGRLLVRVAAAVFDRYLPARAFRSGLSAIATSRVG